MHLPFEVMANGHQLKRLIESLDTHQTISSHDAIPMEPLAKRMRRASRKGRPIGHGNVAEPEDSGGQIKSVIKTLSRVNKTNLKKMRSNRLDRVSNRKDFSPNEAELVEKSAGRDTKLGLSKKRKKADGVEINGKPGSAITIKLANQRETVASTRPSHSGIATELGLRSSRVRSRLVPTASSDRRNRSKDEVSSTHSESAPSTSSLVSHGESRGRKESKKEAGDACDMSTKSAAMHQAVHRRRRETSDEHKLSELIRTDFVTAMKVTETDNFDPKLAAIITDSWRNEWNNGVQVPVSSKEELPKAVFEMKSPCRSLASRAAWRRPKSFVKAKLKQQESVGSADEKSSTNQGEKDGNSSSIGLPGKREPPRKCSTNSPNKQKSHDKSPVRKSNSGNSSVSEKTSAENSEDLSGLSAQRSPPFDPGRSLAEIFGTESIVMQTVKDKQDSMLGQSIDKLSAGGQQEEESHYEAYDCDDLDMAYLAAYNAAAVRSDVGMENSSPKAKSTGSANRRPPAIAPLATHIFEKCMQAMEMSCNSTLDSYGVGSGIEYDDDTVCDVCLSPHGEDGNEMVFCDVCEVCVHQACYGIQAVPEGAWLCRVCAMGVIRPPCILCPNSGGAMKSTRSGQRWSHVSCALWIPEIGFGDADLVEPITNIAGVPEERWLLRCVLCKQKEGACIQCSFKSCSTPYHVTCAQKQRLDIRIETDESHQDVRMVSFCPKHGEKRSPIKVEVEGETEDKEVIRRRRIMEAQDFFFEHVQPAEIAERLDLDLETTVSPVYEYWKLKRKANFNQPLLRMRENMEKAMEKLQENALIRRVRMLVSLRQNLEKARNLCYMVIRREKYKKQFVNSLEDIFVLERDQLDETKLALLTKRDIAIFQNYFNSRWSIYEGYIALTRQVSDPASENSTEPPDSRPVSDTPDVSTLPDQNPPGTSFSAATNLLKSPMPRMNKFRDSEYTAPRHALETPSASIGSFDDGQKIGKIISTSKTPSWSGSKTKLQLLIASPPNGRFHTSRSKTTFNSVPNSAKLARDSLVDFDGKPGRKSQNDFFPSSKESCYNRTFSQPGHDSVSLRSKRGLKKIIGTIKNSKPDLLVHPDCSISNKAQSNMATSKNGEEILAGTKILSTLDGSDLVVPFSAYSEISNSSGRSSRIESPHGSICGDRLDGTKRGTSIGFDTGRMTGELDHSSQFRGDCFGKVGEDYSRRNNNSLASSSRKVSRQFQTSHRHEFQKSKRAFRAICPPDMPMSTLNLPSFDSDSDSYVDDDDIDEKLDTKKERSEREDPGTSGMAIPSTSHKVVPTQRRLDELWQRRNLSSATKRRSGHGRADDADEDVEILSTKLDIEIVATRLDIEVIESKIARTPPSGFRKPTSDHAGYIQSTDVTPSPLFRRKRNNSVVDSHSPGEDLKDNKKNDVLSRSCNLKNWGDSSDRTLHPSNNSHLFPHGGRLSGRRAVSPRDSLREPSLTRRRFRESSMSRNSP